MSALGPIMFDLQGVELSGEERELLQHPLVGGVILFEDNCASRTQLSALVQSIRALCNPAPLIAVDQEGGSVQRLRADFTTLPSARQLGARYTEAPDQTLSHIEDIAWLMAGELADVGVDFSFAPVLDLHRGICPVLAERCYGGEPEPVSRMGQAALRGLSQAGMQAVGKHFPGHGAVREDSHHSTPVDTRSLEEMQDSDLLPFRELIAAGMAGIMVAHILFPALDTVAAGFSRRWLQDILRELLGFQGAIFSDDLGMGGANIGDYRERAQAALDAGCDMLLICKQRERTIEVLDSLPHSTDPCSGPRLAAMRTHRQPMSAERHRRAVRLARQLSKQP